MAQFKERHIWSKVEPIIFDAIEKHIKDNPQKKLDMSKVVRRAVVTYLLDNNAITADEVVQAIA